MSVTNDGDTKTGKNVKLVAALVLSAPEAVICEEELLGPFEQASAGGVIKVVRLLKRGKILVDKPEFFVGLAGLGVSGDDEIVVDIGVGIVDTSGKRLIYFSCFFHTFSCFLQKK